MEADFKYQPLQHSSHIRLLIVLPGEIEDPLFCVILHVGLDNLGKSGLIRFRDTTSNDIGVPDGYDALSYAWGDPKLPKKTMKLAYNQPCIADIERNRHLFANMSITPSLESALKQLRNKDMRNVKWADAVCINQADRAEKEREILKMASIYSSATRVLVWLGLTYEPDYDPPTMAEIPGDEAVWAAFGWFIRINQACTDQECHALDLDVVTNLPALAPSQQEFEGMRILFNRPWFRRVWIVQEVVLAKGPTWILCGKRGQRIELALNSAFFIYKYVTHTAQFGVRNV
ncbi:MAG: hypothetical protein MMC23_009844, partial [Stictis urceolatum]|nr:hypothetical protein [Stictis urceolata]